MVCTHQSDLVGRRGQPLVFLFPVRFSCALRLFCSHRPLPNIALLNLRGWGRGGDGAVRLEGSGAVVIYNLEPSYTVIYLSLETPPGFECYNSIHSVKISVRFTPVPLFPPLSPSFPLIPTLSNTIKAKHSELKATPFCLQHLHPAVQSSALSTAGC